MADNGVNELKCDMCGNISLDQLLFFKHFRVVHKSGNFQQSCSACAKRYGSYRSFRKHLLTHSSSSVGAQNQPQVTDPVQSSSSEDCVFSCDMCNYLTQSCSLLVQHLFFYHRDNNTFQQWCSTCKKCFSEYRGFREHVSQDNPETPGCKLFNVQSDTDPTHCVVRDISERSMTCDMCDHIATNIYLFLDHLNICHKHPNFHQTCPNCDKLFHGLRGLRLHLSLPSFCPQHSPQPVEPNEDPLALPDEDPLALPDENPLPLPDDVALPADLEPQPQPADLESKPVNLAKSTTASVLKFGNSNFVSQTTVTRMTNCFQEINSKRTLRLQQLLSNVVQQHLPPQERDAVNEAIAGAVKTCESEVNDGIRTITSLKRQKKFLRDECCIVEPQLKYLMKDGKRLMWKNNKPKTFVYVSIIDQLQSIFQNPAIYREVTRTITPAGDRHEVADGLMVRNNTFFYPTDDSALLEDGLPCTETPKIIKVQLIISGDDAEMGASLLARAGLNNLCFVYFTIGNFSPRFRSRNSSVFLSLIAKSSLLKKHGHSFFFRPLVDDIKLLEDGVPMLIRGVQHIVSVRVVAVVADNKAKHEYAGFVCSWVAHHCCSMCMASKQEMREIFNAEEFTMRSKELHEQHLEDSQQPGQYEAVRKLTGVTGKSILNEFADFHVTTNMVMEPQHDILHGVLPIVVTAVLWYAIVDRKLLTLDEFNAKLASFDFGYSEQCNIPMPITKDQISNIRKKTVRQNDVQMWQLAIILPILIGPLFLANDDTVRVWRCFVTLIESMRIVFAYTVSDEMLEYLDYRIRYL
jgi:hypothetical protein